MSNFSPIDHLRLWITVHGFPDWDLEDGITHGTYGIVFFLNSKSPNTIPASIAVKTLDPETLSGRPTQLDELQREFSKWIRLPDHRNVLGASPFKAANVPIPDPIDPELKHWIQIPVMPMERMDGTLQEWIGSQEIPLAAKLSALAQAFNGLAHLYKNGIQGHGDLKPSNILFRDISGIYNLPEDDWLSDLPWVVKIADLGWADAWIDLGFTNKALREYIAPERLGTSPTVYPETSDMFSMGIIAAELLSGKHPSINLKRAKESDGEWCKRAKRGEWNLSGISSERVRDFVKRCLDPSAELRPTAREAVHVICQELNETIGMDIEPTLKLWSDLKTQDLWPSISERSEEVDRLMRTRGLGHEVEASAIRRLRQILHAIKPKCIYSMEDWIQAASGLIDFLEDPESPSNQLEVSHIRNEAREHLQNTLGKMTEVDFGSQGQEIEKKDPVTPFERYSHVIGHMAAIARVDFEQTLNGEWDWSPLAISGFAFHRASRARFEDRPARSPIEYLDIAIQQSPSQAVPIFFRALRRREVLIMASIQGTPVDFGIEEVIADLETACRLAPDWREPKVELEKVKKWNL